MIQKDGLVQRFNGVRVAEHLALVVLFAVLAVTGFARHAGCEGWGGTVMKVVGGPEALATLHIVSGLLLTAGLVLHITFNIIGLRRGSVKPSMLVSAADFHQAVQSFRYYTGLEEQRPRYGRYDYKQKFHYWAALFFLVSLICSGLLLAAPAVIAPFLPGQAVPAAAIVHYLSAAGLGILALWHLYDAMFSPDSFPLDTAIFTGRISRRRMREEHPREWEEKGDEE